MTNLRRLILLLILCLGASTMSHAATYYVDYEGGDDQRAGTSPEQAWKHSPGDDAAQGAAKACALKPGDRVRFKGGVRYRGSVGVGVSGAEGQPITFDGNREGGYGAGRAIIDGSQTLTNWTRCASAEDAKGNALWSKIHYADIKDPGGWQALSLCGPEGSLPAAQDPNPSDPMFQERVSEFYHAKDKLRSGLPVVLFPETGTHVNAQRPLVNAVLPGPGSTVVGPIGKATIFAKLDKETAIHEVGIAIQEKYQSIKSIAFLAGTKVIHSAELPEKTGALHRFKLKEPVTHRQFGFRLLSTHGEKVRDWTAVKTIAAFDASGRNVLEVQGKDDGGMSFSDPERLTQADAGYYDGMTLCVHGGHNAAVYLPVTGYDPAKHTLKVGMMRGNVYDSTRYALFNSVKLIDVPGEYAVHALGKGQARVYLMPPKLENDQPAGISYSVRETAFHLNEASHIVVDGFLVERQGGKRASGITARGGKDVLVRHCEVTMVRGSTGISASKTDRIRVEDCYIHHLPGHTKGLVFHTCTNCDTIRTKFVKTTSTSLDYYVCNTGRVSQCEVTEHKGMHANGLTFYVGCKNLIIERNLVYNGNINLTIQEAENVIIRNNIFDGDGGMGMGLWTATPLKNVQIIHNIIIDSDKKKEWATGIFSNNRGPEGLVIKNNIIDGLAGNLPGVFTHNIYTRLGPKQSADNLGEGCVYIPDIKKLLVDPDNRDYRLRPDSPAINAGADLGVDDDFEGRARGKGKPDIGAYELDESLTQRTAE